MNDPSNCPDILTVAFVEASLCFWNPLKILKPANILHSKTIRCILVFYDSGSSTSFSRLDHLSSILAHMPSPFPIPNTCRREFHVSKVLRPILKINYVREHSKCFPYYFENRFKSEHSRLTCSSRRRRPTSPWPRFVYFYFGSNASESLRFRELMGNPLILLDGLFVGKVASTLDGSDCSRNVQSAFGNGDLHILSDKKCPRHVAQVSRWFFLFWKKK